MQHITNWGIEAKFYTLIRKRRSKMSIVEKEIVSLQFYSPEYKGLLENYSLLNEQKRYTAFPLEALRKCENEPDRHPVMILYGDHPAGFFVLHGWDGVKEFSDNENAILLRAYSINSTFQGKGIATDSMRLLPLFIKENFQQKNEIILAVNHANLIAQNVYKKGGFIDKGIRAMGREGEMLILHMDL
jgi:RimJ/RimL family protein N-acetyltransferase